MNFDAPLLRHDPPPGWPWLKHDTIAFLLGSPRDENFGFNHPAWGTPTIESERLPTAVLLRAWWELSARDAPWDARPWLRTLGVDSMLDKIPQAVLRLFENHRLCWFSPVHSAWVRHIPMHLNPRPCAWAASGPPQHHTLWQRLPHPESLGVPPPNIAVGGDTGWLEQHGWAAWLSDGYLHRLYKEAP